jgi:hypothetical protein
MAQLAEMGIQIPEEQRAHLGQAGGWTVISQRVIDEPAVEEPLSIGVRKRKYEGQEEAEEAGETVVRRGWGSTTKRYPAEATEDLDVLLATHKVKKIDETSIKHDDPDSKEKNDFGRETDAVSEQPPAAIAKKEELSDPALTDIPQADAVPIFKKRRSKAAPRDT